MDYSTIKLPKGIKHSIWSVMDAAIYPIVYLATVPILMRSMGLVIFGLWIVINSLITILQLLNFNSGVANLGIVTIRNVSYALANNDPDHSREVINTVFHLTAFMLIVVTGVGWVLSFASVKYNWWSINEMRGINVSLCILLASVLAGLKYFDQVFQSIVKAHESFKLSSILNMINRFGSLTITLLLAVNRFSLVEILYANVAFFVTYLIAEYCCVKWLMPAFEIGRVNDKKLYRRLLRFSIWPWLQSLIIALTFQTDRFWVSSYSGLKEVSCYGLVSTMFNHIHMILTAMVIWIFPRISLMNLKGDDPEKLYSLVRSCLFAVIVISLLFFYFLSPFLFRIWVGADTYVRMAAYIKGFVAFEIVFAHTIMPFFYLNAIGKEQLATKATLFYCSTCYAFMLGGLYFFHSTVAMVGGMTIAMCITMPIINGIVQQSMYKKYSWKLAIFEMLPMYTTILLIYGNENIWKYVLLLPILTLLLWKYYLSNIFSNFLWPQTPST